MLYQRGHVFPLAPDNATPLRLASSVPLWYQLHAWSHIDYVWCPTPVSRHLRGNFPFCYKPVSVVQSKKWPCNPIILRYLVCIIIILYTFFWFGLLTTNHCIIFHIAAADQFPKQAWLKLTVSSLCSWFSYHAAANNSFHYQLIICRLLCQLTEQ